MKKRKDLRGEPGRDVRRLTDEPVAEIVQCGSQLCWVHAGHNFHGPGRMGLCRTFVFARENSAPAILDAIRAKRTVVYGRDGRAYGDPALIPLAAADGRLPAAARPQSSYGWLDRVSQVFGLLGIAALAIASRRWK